jgi:hypothetical protein
MLCMHRNNRRGKPPMSPRNWRRIAAWVGVAALLCQVFLPLGLARLADAADRGVLAQAAQNDHYHDPGLANALGPDGIATHSHAGDTPSSRVRFDLGHLTPFAVVSPPEAPAVVLPWITVAADRMAPAPTQSDGFTRPLPRAPPLPA